MEVGTSKSEQRVKIWVKDNGPGISAEELPHIFERFYRGGDQVLPGSGLGLAITHRIVQAHGWSISAHSGVGEGTQFTIECNTQ